MSSGRGSKTSIWIGLTDLLFRATTSRMRPEALWPVGRVPQLDKWRAAGGHLRAAGPKWFVVWGRDNPRMQRLATLVLPVGWLGLSEEEMTAYLLFQLRAVDPSLPETPAYSAAFARAASHLRLALMRGD